MLILKYIIKNILNMRTTTIYALIDPITNQLRYIGKTNNIIQRYKAHLKLNSAYRNIHKRNWINKLKQLGLKPEIEIIDIVSINEWQYWEIFWIAYYKGIGCNLLNHTIGGDGAIFGNETTFKIGHGAIPIYQIDLKGNIINVFESSENACIFLKFKVGEIDKIGRTTHDFIFYKKETWDNLSKDEKNNIIDKASRKNRFGHNGINTRFKSGEINNNILKPVKQIDINSGITINIFPSIKYAKKQTGASKIGDVAAGKRNTSGGYKWEFI